MLIDKNSGRSAMSGRRKFRPKLFKRANKKKSFEEVDVEKEILKRNRAY